MVNRMKKYLFFDVDGTLFDHSIHRIPESAMQAIIQTKKNGNAIFLCTGRALMDVSHLRFLPWDGIIFCNGAGVEMNGEIVFSQAISDYILRDFMHSCDVYGVGYCLQGIHKKWINHHAEPFFAMFRKRFQEQYPDQSFHIAFQYPDSITDYKGESIFKIDITYEPKQEEIMLDIESLVPKQLHFIPMISTVQKHHYGGEITMSDINKGNTALWLLSRLGAEAENAYGFGDSLNDYELLKQCGTGIAMGNAKDELKEIADYITKDISDDGIYHAMKHFKLI